LRWPRDTLYQLKLALTSPTGCGRSVGIVRLRTKTTKFSFSLRQVFCTSCTGRALFWPVNSHSSMALQSAGGPFLSSDRRLSAKLVPAFADRECRVVSATDPQGRILGFLGRSRYYFFQVAPQLSSRGWVDPVLDPLLLRKSGRAGNRTRNPCYLLPETLNTRPQGRSLCQQRFLNSTVLNL
jgi:hypothetical protein